MLDARTVMLISNLIFEDGDKYWMYAFPSFRTAMCTLIIVLKLMLLNRRTMVSGPGWLARIFDILYATRKS